MLSRTCMLGKSFIIKRLIANGKLKDFKLTMNVSKSTLVNTLDAFESSVKASFYARMIISMILIISIFQSLAASARTVGAQNCVLPYTHL